MPDILLSIARHKAGGGAEEKKKASPNRIDVSSLTPNMDETKNKSVGAFHT